MMASVSAAPTTIRTEPHKRLLASYSLEDEECSSQEEEELLPPPQSWFEEQHDDYFERQDSVDLEDGFEDNQGCRTGSIRNRLSPPCNVVCTTMEESDRNRYAPVVGKPRKAPSWRELSSQVLPAAARELLSSSMRRVYHYSLVSYAKGRWTRKYSDLRNNAGGYFRSSQLPMQLSGAAVELPPFSSLPWVDRQLVQEWRTCDYTFEEPSAEVEDDDEDFDRARTLVPQPNPKPIWQKAEVCFDCHKPFGPTLLRHHCRLCGKSFCQSHSAWTHKLPHLGYDPDVPERVCDPCKRLLLEQNLAERVAWRLARCRDYFDGDLTPYFETGVDSVEEVALRVTKAAIAMARSIPLGAQAHVAVETVEVLRKHGLKGIYGLILRKEFMAAADLLCRALGINKTAWPLSVHELSAAIFYALAQHRAMRGLSPEREHLIHTFKDGQSEAEKDESEGETIVDGGTEWGPFVSAWTVSSPPKQLESSEEHGAMMNNCGREEEGVEAVNRSATLVDETDTYDPRIESVADLIAMADNAILSHHQNSINGATSLTQGETADEQKTAPADDVPPAELPFSPVCEPVSDQVISSVIFYAPIALNFVYALREVDMQLLAAQQGWRLLYAHLEQDTLDRPASALFVHSKQKIACFAVRGTATINDVVTDIRQMPVPFPEKEEDRFEDDWTPVFRGQGLAVCGMARAAVNLYREHIDALVTLAEKGYRIRITGHSLGGGVATLLGALVLRHIENVANLGDSLGKAFTGDGSPPKNSVIVERNDLLRVYGYGTPSCVDAKLSDYVKTFVTTVVLHDDLVPRLTPTSIRGLLKHLLHIRETWVKAHLTDDLLAITERARTVWAPRWRGSFTISKSSSKTFKRYCRKQIQKGKRKLMTVKGQLVGSIKEENESSDNVSSKEQNGSGTEEFRPVEISPVEEISSTIFAGVKEVDIPNNTREADDSFEKCSGKEKESFQKLSFDSEPDTRLIMDYMGGIDYRTQGIVIDGDEFFDADESLLEDEEEDELLPVDGGGDEKLMPVDEDHEDDVVPVSEGHVDEPHEVPAFESHEDELVPVVEEDASSVGDLLPGTALGNDAACTDQSREDSLSETRSQPNGHVAASPPEDDSWARFDASLDDHHTDTQVTDDTNSPRKIEGEPFGNESEGLEEGDEAGAVLLDETPLPRMFLPGKIVHIYTHRGGYKAAYVPRAFRELRRISLAGNMLTDHTSKAYYESLLEVQSVRKAVEGLPRWTAFDEDDTCSCCASRFTWASTSDSEAQEARDKHNCRSCGTLVCNPCSPNRIPLPSIGIMVPVRVCDRCYNDLGGVLTGHSGHALTSSFMEEPGLVGGEERHEEIAYERQHSDISSLSPTLGTPEVTFGSGPIQPPERQRERRSKVVDELASRIHSSSVLSNTSA